MGSSSGTGDRRLRIRSSSSGENLRLCGRMGPILAATAYRWSADQKYGIRG
jgi:hypothetical protein